MQFKKLCFAFAIGAATLIASPAFAGSKVAGQHVKLIQNGDGSGTVSGQFGAVYNGRGVQEYLGCEVRAPSSLFCHARTEAGVYATCSSGSAYMAKMIGTLSSDAMLTVSWNARGVCTTITVLHSSELEPKL